MSIDAVPVETLSPTASEAPALNDEVALDSRVVPDAASGVATSEAASGRPVGPKERRPRIQTYPTVKLDPKDLKPTWPIVIASLEQLSDWTILALRLGTLALIQGCLRELAYPDARADLVVRLRALTEALAHMPLEA